MTSNAFNVILFLLTLETIQAYNIPRLSYFSHTYPRKQATSTATTFIRHQHYQTTTSLHSSNKNNNEGVGVGEGRNNPLLLLNRRDTTRRILLGSVALLPFTIMGANNKAVAADVDTINENNELIDVYFGCGCFWHVQHEFVEAEKRILQRKGESLTARAAYAGGMSKDETVCYHNARGLGDYGSLGHAEVVMLRIPPKSLYDFAVEYFNLFNAKGDRPDQFGDRGSEYRNLVGVPGGVDSPYAKTLVSASLASGDKLDFAVGKGNDTDKRAVTFVMDTAKYPPYEAERYHQFHDGFNIGENYPDSYNNLAKNLDEIGLLKKNNPCPNGTFGIGVAGL